MVINNSSNSLVFGLWPQTKTKKSQVKFLDLRVYLKSIHFSTISFFPSPTALETESNCFQQKDGQREHLLTLYS